jgi:hypothetical protein
MKVNKGDAEAQVEQHFISLCAKGVFEAAPQPGPPPPRSPGEEPHSSSSARVDPDGAEAMDDGDSPGPAVQLEGGGNESNVRAGADCMETDGARSPTPPYMHALAARVCKIAALFIPPAPAPPPPPPPPPQKTPPRGPARAAAALNRFNFSTD